MRKFIVPALMAVLAASLLAGCSMFMRPSASATIISPNIKRAAGKVETVGPVVSESDCYYYWLIFGSSGNYNVSHERLVQKILDRYKADILLDADLSYSAYGLPLIFTWHCAEVTGQPARLVAGSEVKK